VFTFFLCPYGATINDFNPARPSAETVLAPQGLSRPPSYPPFNEPICLSRNGSDGCSRRPASTVKAVIVVTDIGIALAMLDDGVGVVVGRARDDTSQTYGTESKN
jgi:serine/threonine kinase PknH